MRPITIAAVVLASVPLVVGCGRKTEAQAAASSFGIDAPATKSRCSNGTLADADNPNCKRQGDENFNKFIGKGGGS